MSARSPYAIALRRTRQSRLHGHAVSISIPSIPGISRYQKDLAVRLADNPARSRALLADAGCPNGFKIQLNRPSDGSINSEAICRAAATPLAEVQVRVSLNLQPWSAFVPPHTRLQSSFHVIGAGPTDLDAEDTLHGAMMTRGDQGRVREQDHRLPSLASI